VLRWRATLVIAFILALTGLVVTAYGPIDQCFVVNGSRFGLMFLAGAMVYTFRDTIPVSWPLIAVAGAVIAASSWLPDYRVVAVALPIAYLAMSSGALLKHPKLRLPNDISYGTYVYAFPMQQLLASAGLYKLGVPMFAIVSIVVTLPVAAASWFALERPALKLKLKLKLKGSGRAKAPAGFPPPDLRKDGEPASTTTTAVPEPRGSTSSRRTASPANRFAR